MLALMNLDDFAIGISLPIALPRIYWVAISWIFPVYAAFAFFLFGKLHEKKGSPLMQI
jgi:hypothetical protein